MDSSIKISHFKLPTLGVLIRLLLSLCAVLVFFASPATALRSIRNSTRSRGDQWKPSSILAWNNISGSYIGSWGLMDSKNSHFRSSKIRKTSGDFVFELISTPTRLNGVHFVKGMIIFYDLFDNEYEVGGAKVKVEGIYTWPFKQLRMVAYRGEAGEFGLEEDYILYNPYHMLGVFTSRVFQKSLWDKMWKMKNSPADGMEKDCSMEIAAQISLVPSMQSNGVRYSYQIEGSMESFLAGDHGDCLQPIQLKATFVNADMYFIKAINYNLMVTFNSFLQVLLLIRQMKHSETQYGAARVSITTIGQQAIMDAYLCALHLTAGITVESLFNAFATAAFFKFVLFFIFEIKYIHAIWKANRPATSQGSLEERREVAVLYSRFCGIFLGGILIMYEFHKFLPFILLLVHSFWIPQIITNIVRDRRKALHPYYIIGMSLTRLAIPLYVFGCPHNFLRTKPDKNWCIVLVVFVGLQAVILLLQHYLGSGSFIIWQIFPKKYSYHKKSDPDINDATNCVICLTAIDFSQPPNICMVTPCGHFFHSECLREWMDINMVCPTCRRRLPPL